MKEDCNGRRGPQRAFEEQEEEDEDEEEMKEKRKAKSYRIFFIILFKGGISWYY